MSISGENHGVGSLCFVATLRVGFPRAEAVVVDQGNRPEERRDWQADDYRDGSTTVFANPITETNHGDALPGGQPWSGPMDIVSSGLRLIEWFGVGGMGTRGFGRVAVVGEAVSTAFEGGN